MRRRVNKLNKLIEGVISSSLSKLLPDVRDFADELNELELEQWAKWEIEGYFPSAMTCTDEIAIPEYRGVAGMYFPYFVNSYDQEGIPDQADLELINKYRLPHGAAQLEQMAKSNGIITIREPSMPNSVRKDISWNAIYFICTPKSASDVLTNIRSELSGRLEGIRPRIEEAPLLKDEFSRRLTSNNLPSLEPHNWLHNPFWASLLASVIVAIVTLPVWWRFLWNWLRTFEKLF